MIKYIMLSLFLVGCGTEALVDERTEKCSVKETSTGAEINCPDGTKVDINDGRDGVDGAIGASGQDGERGEPGAKGNRGVAGEACEVMDHPDGVLMTCGNSVSIIPRGETGNDGKDGAAPELPSITYQGYYCSRTVVSIGDSWYVMNSQLVPLTSTWYKISSTCEIRINKGIIGTK